MKRSLVAYVPVLHQGYLDFVKNAQPDDMYVLGDSCIDNIPRLDRDIRAISPTTMQHVLNNIGFVRTYIFEPSTASDLMLAKANIIMPDEDVSHSVQEKYFGDYPVTYINAFLRWDKQASLAKHEINPDRIITSDEVTKNLLRIADEAAKQSPDWWRQVGGVLVIDGEPVLCGYNKHPGGGDYGVIAFGDPRGNFDAGECIDVSKALHCEAGLIAEAAKQGLSTNGAELVVTTYPCPNCARIVAAAGIKKVYYRDGYSMLDAEDIMKSYNIEVVLIQEPTQESE